MKRLIEKLFGLGKQKQDEARETKERQPRALERLQRVALRDVVYHEQKAGTLA